MALLHTAAALDAAVTPGTPVAYNTLHGGLAHIVTRLLQGWALAAPFGWWHNDGASA